MLMSCCVAALPWGPLPGLNAIEAICRNRSNKNRKSASILQEENTIYVDFARFQRVRTRCVKYAYGRFDQVTT